MNNFINYSKPEDLAPPQSNVIMSTGLGDRKIPYSFSEWIKRNVGVIPGKEKEQYNIYLINWYKSQKIDKEKINNQLKEDYKGVLEQLSLVFKEDIGKYFGEINFDDNADLERVIPYFTKRLKDIAIYYVNKREALKKSKIKYNTAGSKQSLEKLFYEYILKAFTKNNTPGNEYITSYMPASTLANLPSLSSVLPYFEVKIQELYDDTSYFDKNPNINASTYFNLTSEKTIDFLTTLGLQATATQWLFNTGFYPVCGNFNPMFDIVQNEIDYIIQTESAKVSAFESPYSDTLNIENQILLSEKYLGGSQNYYFTSGGFYEAASGTLQVNMEAGNNWFYWPYGELVYENSEFYYFDPIPLTATNVFQSSGTAGKYYDNSDVIFVRNGENLQGAWLRLEGIETTYPVMSTELVRGRTIFKFPWSGYGLSGEGLEWTGREIDNLDKTYYYLDNETQQEIQHIYWNTLSSSLSVYQPIPINDTSLIDCSATPSTVFGEGDWIIVRNNYQQNGTGIYIDQQNYAYLYKFTQTDLQVANGRNVFYWPYYTVEEALSAQQANINPASACIPMKLNDIPMKYWTGAISNNDITKADTIFKLNSPNGYALDAAWLSGKPFTTSNTSELKKPYNVINSEIVSAPTQIGLSFMLKAGSFAYFIWGDTNTLADKVFKYYEHQSDCVYRKFDKYISYFNDRNITSTDDPNYFQWQWCNCYAIPFSPIGHSGNTYEDFGKGSDFILSVTNPTVNLDLETWKDSKGLTYKESDEFGWFKITGKHLEPDIGWGEGKWLTYSGKPFMLSSNLFYSYYRNNLFRDELNDDENMASPYYNVKYTYPNFGTPKQKWIKMHYDKVTQSWINDNEESSMILNPGEYFSYNHQDTYNFILSAQITTIKDEIVLRDPNNNNFKPLLDSLNIPYQTTTVILSSVKSLNFDTTSTVTTATTSISGNSVIDYFPVALQLPTGNTVSLNADVFKEYINKATSPIITAMGSVTSVQSFENEYNLQNVEFVVNIPLSGWNYDTYMFDGSSSGARPFWAKAYDTDAWETKRKGVDIWGGAIRYKNYLSQLTQPILSDIVLDQNTYVEYVRKNDTPIFWIQPLVYNHYIDNGIWSKLTFTWDNSASDKTVINYRNELVISASNEPSDIVLSCKSGEPLLINYYAMSGFLWSQPVNNSTYGFAPTGGIYNPPVSSTLLQTVAPWANLTNRHYPTVASFPDLENFYKESDIGGYFIPKMLGTSTFLGRKFTTYLDTTSKDLSSTFKIYNDKSIYAKDNGLTKSNQNIYSLIDRIDSSWMKSGLTEARKSTIINNHKTQNFVPYQVKYETVNFNEYGIYRQSDRNDPWFGDKDTVWEDNVEWPANIKNQYDIEGWYAQFPGADKYIYQYKSDIYGNQYFLMKTNNPYYSFYDKMVDTGEIWTRDARNNIKQAIYSLDNIYDNLSSLTTSQYELQNIIDFDIFNDTLMLQTSAHVFFSKLYYDEYLQGTESSKIYTILDEIHWINLSDSKIYCGTWYNDKEKIVDIGLINTALSGGYVYFYPTIYTLDLKTNELLKTFTSTPSLTSELYNITSFNILSTIDKPVFTYNDQQKMYNFGLTTYSNNSSYQDGMFLHLMNIKKFGNKYSYDKCYTIVPVPQ